jgi:hypothetical protein
MHVLLLMQVRCSLHNARNQSVTKTKHNKAHDLFVPFNCSLVGYDLSACLPGDVYDCVVTCADSYHATAAAPPKAICSGSGAVFTFSGCKLTQCAAQSSPPTGYQFEPPYSGLEPACYAGSRYACRYVMRRGEMCWRIMSFRSINKCATQMLHCFFL